MKGGFGFKFKFKFKKNLSELCVSAVKKPRIVPRFIVTAEALRARRMAPAIPARSANPSLPEAEIRMGEGGSEGAKAGPYRRLNVRIPSGKKSLRTQRPWPTKSWRSRLRGNKAAGSLSYFLSPQSLLR